MLRSAHLIPCPHFANPDLWVPKRGNTISPLVSELGLKSRFPPSKKRKTLLLSQPTSSQPCLSEPTMQEHRETCWKEAGA